MGVGIKFHSWAWIRSKYIASPIGAKNTQNSIYSSDNPIRGCGYPMGMIPNGCGYGYKMLLTCISMVMKFYPVGNWSHRSCLLEFLGKLNTRASSCGDFVNFDIF